MQQQQTAVDTSIVVCTCSRAALLRGALDSLLRQDWAADHSVELIIVDDGSTDNTPQLLADVAAHAILPVRILNGPRQGIAAARNLGFAHAQGKWIASFDDDQVASPHWLRALRERAHNEDAACVGGSLILVFPDGTPAAPLGSRVRSILGEHAPSAEAIAYPRRSQPATNNALIRRDVFLALGRFDTNFTEGGEDKDLFQRARTAGHTLWFEPAATADHITPGSRLALRNLRWTSVRLGASDARSVLRSGYGAAVKLIILRLLSTVFRDGPGLLFTGTTDRLDARCGLWYTTGFLRGLLALHYADPAKTAFLQSLNFRNRNGERPGSPHSPASARALQTHASSPDGL